jgi:multicomponent Na+:H+ antiporter subunit C
MNYSIGEIVALILFFIGVYGVISHRNIIKTVISVGVMVVAAILFFFAREPLATNLTPITEAGVSVDPYSQGTIITAIVIGVGVTAVAFIMLINLYKKYGKADWNKRRKNRKDN